MARKEFEINIDGNTKLAYWLYENVVTPIVDLTATTGEVSQALSPGKFYKFGTVTSLTLTLVAPEPCADGTVPLTEYSGKFQTAANWGGSGLNVPSSVALASGNDLILASKTYEFSIIDNIIIIRDITPIV